MFSELKIINIKRSLTNNLDERRRRNIRMCEMRILINACNLQMIPIFTNYHFFSFFRVQRQFEFNPTTCKCDCCLTKSWSNFCGYVYVFCVCVFQLIESVKAFDCPTRYLDEDSFGYRGYFLSLSLQPWIYVNDAIPSRNIPQGIAG